VDARPRLDLGDPELREHPYDTYEQLARSCPVAEDPGAGLVVVAGYENLVAVAQDFESFTRADAGDGPRRTGLGDDPVQRDVAELQSRALPEANALVTCDPPEHTRHRKVANAAFNPRRVRAQEASIRAIANSYVDAFAGDGTVELLSQFAGPFPLAVISDMLGIGRVHMDDLKRWSDLVLAAFSRVMSHQERREMALAVLESQAFFLPMIHARRRDPRDDLLSDLVNARPDDGGPLSDEELLPILRQITSAGHATSTNFIANATVLALRSPEHLRRLRADRTLIPAFLEETLRFDPPLHATLRRATRDLVFCGVPIREHEVVAPLWASGGMDPSVFARPQEFRLNRENARRHLAFGRGLHFCVGAELARLEGRIALEVLLSRLPGLRLDEAASDLTHPINLAHRGYRRVVLSFDPDGAG
jgi:cytochrome P450